MPTYNEIFYAEFVEMPNKGLNLTPAQFRISFLLDGYTGATSELDVYAKSPCRISKTDSSSDRFVPIHPQKATFSLRCKSVPTLDAFRLNSDRQLKVVVKADYSGGTNYTDTPFSGWSVPTELSADYKKPPFELEMTAVCGLAGLKDRDLLTSDGKRLNGLVSLIEVLRTALSKTDLGLDVITGLNLFSQGDVAGGQTASAAKDPLYQTLVNAESFVNEKGGVLSCYDAIDKVLKPFNARVAQINGAWWIVRADEVAGGWDVWNNPATLHTRTYTGTNYASAPVSHTSRDLNVYAYPSEPVQVLRRSPKVGYSTIKTGVRVEQAFGRTLSRLGDFSQVDSTGLPLNYYVNNIQVANRFREGTGTDADPYRMVLYGAGDQEYNNDTPYILKRVTYTLQSPEYTKFIKRTFKCRARLTNAKSAKLVFIAVRDDGAYLNVPGDGWVKYSKLKKKQLRNGAHLFQNSYQDESGRTKTKSTWFDISVDLGEIDRVINFEVYYCVAEALDRFDSNGNYLGAETGQNGIRPKVEYQAGYLEGEQRGFIVDGTQQTIVQTGKTVKDTSLSMTLGDVPGSAKPYDRIGTLYYRLVNNNFITTDLWYRPNANILAPNPIGKDVGRSLLNWNVIARAKQSMYSASSFDGDLIGRLPFGPFAVLRVNDVGYNGPLDKARAIPHQLTKWEYDLVSCKQSVSGVEMLTAEVVLPTTLAEWQTPDGLAPMNTIEDGVPDSPPEKPFISKADELKNKLAGLGILPTTPRLVGTIPALFTPQDPSDPQFSGTGYIGGVKQGTVLSALRQHPFLIRPT